MLFLLKKDKITKKIVEMENLDFKKFLFCDADLMKHISQKTGLSGLDQKVKWDLQKQMLAVDTLEAFQEGFDWDFDQEMSENDQK